MSSERRSAFWSTVGFRLAVWSSTVFVVGALTMFGLAYVLLSASLDSRDRAANLRPCYAMPLRCLR